MTEQEFEQRIETAADRLDKGIPQKYNRSRLFHVGVKTALLALGVGLIFGAGRLAKRGHKTATTWCFFLGVLGIITEILKSLAFRRQ